MKARIYHNPRCSKSRAALALLEERGVPTEVIEYLQTPPSEQTLRALLSKLAMRPIDLIRRNEPEFKESGLGAEADDETLLRLMLEHPRLIERPIVEVGAQARLGRPLERILDLLP